jgi:DNA-binding CsgD family transcriptional regulator
MQQHKLARQRDKYEKEQQQLRYMHQLELEGSEREIVKLRNEKLENEVSFKNKELATVTMHLVQRGKLLSRLKEELEKVLKNIQPPASANEFRKLVRMLGDDEKSEEDWEQFAIHFDQVHSNFLTSLKAKHSNLSSADLKLCAYLRMNLSSKEIAQLLNISLRGVEMSRYRLRKKLQVSSETNLFDYLISIGTGSE